MRVKTQSSHNKNLEVKNYMIKGLSKIIVSIENFGLACGNLTYKTRKVIL